MTTIPSVRDFYADEAEGEEREKGINKKNKG